MPQASTPTMPKRSTHTERTKKGVCYMVFDDELDIIVWRTFVEYGDDAAHQKGGSAFEAAAKRMQRFAQKGR